MRTTLDLPLPLIEEAQRLLAYKSKTDAVIFALQELIRRNRIHQLKELAGTIDLSLDLDASRRRPKGRGNGKRASRKHR